ncbi:Uncharacterized protein DAT39_002449 [Clarias magur]|uniref:Uncharacterized protein n=1 Tax=Clarias magur TaxID=1594786 RepID=A0A8J4U705_CLAMG|nr:Uncharacterized protein DAT39_002449 [Clarias magur]
MIEDLHVATKLISFFNRFEGMALAHSPPSSSYDLPSSPSSAPPSHHLSRILDIHHNFPALHPSRALKQPSSLSNYPFQGGCEKRVQSPLSRKGCRLEWPQPKSPTRIAD